jgi:NAD-dependent deacetylase
MTPTELPSRAIELLDDAGGGRVVFLTGAGISAESGIPTFRGKEGYWKVGSVNYHPMELATHDAFTRFPDEVWAWYLYRRGVCLAARPNSAHLALAELEASVRERFVLITQNVDGLHVQAGNSRERTFQIHGDIRMMRCADECGRGLLEVPRGIDRSWEKERPLADAERALLICPDCGARSRPHVLWFDEYYNEEHFRFESSLNAAHAADLLVVVGTAGTTNLPLQVGAVVARRGAAMIVVNPEETAFTEFATQTPSGLFLRGKAGEWVPALCAALRGGDDTAP